MPRRRRRDGPIRIAYLTPTLEIGGAERQMLILAANLPKDEFEIRFVLISRGGAMADSSLAAGVPMYRLGLDQTACAGFHPRCMTAGLRALRRYRAAAADVDIVDAWLVPSQIFAAAARAFVRPPILIGGRRSLDDVYATKSRLRRTLASMAARRMDLIVANSSAAATDAIRNDGIDPARVRVIPNAVLPAPPAQPRAAIRAGWGIGDEAIVIGCVGNYKPEKGHRHLIEAAARLRDRSPQLRYVLVGEGPLRSDLESRIRRSNLDGVVVLAGQAADARTLYPGFDIVVQASDTEGLPNVILEAAAAGSAIVATAVGGTSEILTDERDGILVPRADVDALVLAIERLATDVVARHRFGAAARLRSFDFSSDRLIAQTAELYRQLVLDGPPPRRRARSASISS